MKIEAKYFRRNHQNCIMLNLPRWLLDELEYNQVRHSSSRVPVTGNSDIDTPCQMVLMFNEPEDDSYRTIADDELGEPVEVDEEFPDYTVHSINSVECYTSNSGNRTWKVFDEDGTIIYLRQSNKPMLQEAELWDKLQAIQIGETWDVEDAIVHTVKDGDFHKPVQFDGKWTFQKPEPVTPEHERLAIQAAKGWLNSNCVILDTETTGLEDAYPIEVTVIDLDGKELFNQRIKPPDGIVIEAGATKVHGISADDVKDCPEWKDVYADFVAAVKDKTVLIYNADFDIGVLNDATAFYKLDDLVIDDHCVMRTYAQYNGNWNFRHQSYSWISLSEAMKKEGLPVNDAHTALGDCQMTLALVKALAAKPIVEHSDIPF